jgi:hypothetical protein
MLDRTLSEHALTGDNGTVREPWDLLAKSHRYLLCDNVLLKMDGPGAAVIDDLAHDVLTDRARRDWLLFDQDGDGSNP